MLLRNLPMVFVFMTAEVSTLICRKQFDITGAPLVGHPEPFATRPDIS
jgi:hypothetical protein